MLYEIKPPKTDKDGLINFVKTIANNLEVSNASEAHFKVIDLIDTLSSECVKFSWGRVSTKRADVAAYCAENPTMVD